jgi:hypothetical protein
MNIRALKLNLKFEKKRKAVSFLEIDRDDGFLKK